MTLELGLYLQTYSSSSLYQVPQNQIKHHKLLTLCPMISAIFPHCEVVTGSVLWITSSTCHSQYNKFSSLQNHCSSSLVKFYSELIYVSRTNLNK